MNNNYELVYVEHPEEQAWGVIGHGVSRYNKKQAGENNFERLCYVLKNVEGDIVAGILGELYWGWLYIDLLWVKGDLRRHGYGSALLNKIEAAAQEKGAKQAYLDTFSFQSPGFYKQHGYQVFGELKGFPEGHNRFFLLEALREVTMKSKDTFRYGIVLDKSAGTYPY